jgi:hypothetical protein
VCDAGTRCDREFYFVLMSNTCTFCQTPIVLVRAGESEFRACPKCHATFFPAKHFGAIRGSIDAESRRLWAESLAISAQSFQMPAGPVNCMDHGQPLQEGTLPDVVVPGLVASCCSMLHLPPQLMHDLLARGLKVKEVRKDLKSDEGAWRKVISFLFGWMDSKDRIVDDGLDGALWALKLKPIYGQK